MNKKFTLILLAMLALTLNACTRAASTAPLVTPTLEANFPKPVATSGMNAIEVAGTQTALATASLPMPSAEAGTEGPIGSETATPLAGLNQTPVVVEPTSSTNATAVNTALPTPTVGVTAVVTAAPVTKPGAYVLHDGEFPYCLARRYNVNPDELLTLNGLSSAQSYYAPGTSITIPQSGGAFPGPRSLKAHPTAYTVRAGDTIYSVACEFGDVDPMGIVSVNSLTGSYTLTAGAQIQIP
ncbi:MAG: LysM peptidoglycan-binding domain-containing protein [Chloroflexi bacterium]|nr:LysM peptidoglycan-binding domain-containing protein [Chloroflexota bacterium]